MSLHIMCKDAIYKRAPEIAPTKWWNKKVYITMLFWPADLGI